TFSSADGTTVGNFAQLNPDGTLDTSFNPGGVGADNSVFGVAVQADGRLLIGGRFTGVNGTARHGSARLGNDPATQRLAAPDSTQVRWQRGGASPEVSQVSFELSTNGGATWDPLG